MSRALPRWSALVATVATLAGVLVSVLVPAPAAAYPSADVLLDGHGWGHGRGLGQYGSLGYAVDEAKPYSWIVDHYYGGTTRGTRADGVISVKLVFLDGTTTAPTDMTVTSKRAFTIGTNAYAAGEFARVRYTANGWAIERAPACGGPWAAAQTVDATARPEAKTSTDYTGDDITQMLTVLEPAAGKTCDQWNKRTYRGSLMIAVLDSVFTRVLNWVPMEQYLRGVVPRESPASWGSVAGGKGMEALKAQAVAARSYAWAEQRGTDYKTCDTTACQVYGGAGLNGVRSEDSRSDAAVAATAGEVRVTSSGAVARTEFSSSTGGYTAGGTFTAVPDTGDDVCLQGGPCNPNHDWSAKVPVSTVEAAYPTIGTLRSIQVTRRNGLGADGGRVLTVKVNGTSASVDTTGDSLRSKLGLKSDWFTIVDVVFDVIRVKGDDRVATAAAVSRDLFADGTARSAVIVSSANYADAVVGAPLAVAKGGPILLSSPASVPAATMTELQRATGGGKVVYVLGGEGALSGAVRTQLESAGYTVTRYGGDTRYGTAVLVAGALGDPATVLEATGADFPDALSAGTAAAKVGGAVLLTAGSVQAKETAAYLQGRNVKRYAVGGAAAAADPSAEPLKGADRYETAIAVANKFFPGPAVAGLASGESYFDALSGGVHAAVKGGPLVLTRSSTLPTSTEQYLQGNSDVTLGRVYVYGGTAAVSDAVIADLKQR